MTNTGPPKQPSPRAAADAVRGRTSRKPTVGLVLGSGLGGFASLVEGAKRIPYEDIVGMPTCSVAGHAGALLLGRLSGAAVAVLEGRVHLYEGHEPDRVTFGVRLLAELGCTTVLLTNAAGGIREGLSPGDLMLIDDHINLMGKSPLVGQAEAFVDMTEAYDSDVRAAAERAARSESIALASGTYAAVLGPSYETPAEVRMLRTLGADAVGMSTVPETLALVRAGVRVGALSCITNLAAGLGEGPLSHDDVSAVASQAQSRVSRLLPRWVEQITEGDESGGPQ